MTNNTVSAASFLVSVRVGGTTFVNLNKHDIALEHNGETHVFPPSGQVATVKTQDVTADEAGGFPCVKTSFGDVQGLPEPQHDTVYIVNAMVLDRCKDRSDVVAPDTGPSALRFADGPQKGQVRAVTRFKRP